MSNKSHRFFAQKYSFAERTLSHRELYSTHVTEARFSAVFFKAISEKPSIETRKCKHTRKFRFIKKVFQACDFFYIVLKGALSITVIYYRQIYRRSNFFPIINGFLQLTMKCSNRGCVSTVICLHRLVSVRRNVTRRNFLRKNVAWRKALLQKVVELVETFLRKSFDELKPVHVKKTMYYSQIDTKIRLYFSSVFFLVSTNLFS